MKLVEHWLYDRPYSILTFSMFGLTAGVLSKIWEPLLFIPIALLLGLLVYFAFFTPAPDSDVEQGN
jgi:hypothetical protein